MNSITKKCTKCGITKELHEFGKDKKRSDGKNCWCKECHRVYYKSNVEIIIAKVKEYASTRKEQKSLYDKARRDNDDGTIKEKKKEYFQKNKEQLLKVNKEYAQTHLDKMRGYRNAWKKKNKDKVLVYARNRFARVKWNGGVITQLDIDEMFNKYGKACLKCGSTDRVEVDHVIPVARGGINDKTNIQPLCRRCNSSKGAKTEDYR